MLQDAFVNRNSAITVLRMLKSMDLELVGAATALCKPPFISEIGGIKGG
jgi:hypothetical protein